MPFIYYGGAGGVVIWQVAGLKLETQTHVCSAAREVEYHGYLKKGWPVVIICMDWGK